MRIKNYSQKFLESIGLSRTLYSGFQQNKLMEFILDPKVAHLRKRWNCIGMWIFSLLLLARSMPCSHWRQYMLLKADNKDIADQKVLCYSLATICQLDSEDLHLIKYLLKIQHPVGYASAESCHSTLESWMLPQKPTPVYPKLILRL